MIPAYEMNVTFLNNFITKKEGYERKHSNGAF